MAALASSAVSARPVTAVAARHVGVRATYRVNAQPSARKVIARAKRSEILFGGETSPPLPPSLDEDDLDDDFPFCAVAYASVDNEAHPTSSLLQVTVSAVPGVMRILSWLLNGLDLKLEEAAWEIEDAADEGDVDVMEIKMWVTELRGNSAGKVRDTAGLEERLTEYMRFCTQAERRYHPVVEHGGVRIDNLVDPDTTVLTVRSQETGGESLLSVASTITGLGLRMKRAKLMPGKKGGPSVWEFRLTVMEASKMKLTNTQVQGLLYTLCLVFNKDKKFGGADYMVEKMTSEAELPTVARAAS